MCSYESLTGSDQLGRCKTPDEWGIDVWFLIEAAMSGHKIKEVYLGRKDFTSFEAYEKDIGKLHRMAEQVLFTILNEAVKYGKFKSQYNQVSLKNIFMQPTENVQTI